MITIAEEIVVWRKLVLEKLGHIVVTDAFSERCTGQNPQFAILLDASGQLLQSNGPVFLVELSIALVNRRPKPE